jgi:hypothetical protein
VISSDGTNLITAGTLCGASDALQSARIRREFRRSACVAVAVGQNDIHDHDGAGDRAAARFGARHPHFRLPVDDRFDLLGMNLEAADIDDAAAPPDEMIAIAAQFHHVAGIDEAVASVSAAPADIGMRGSRERIRSEPSSTFISTPSRLARSCSAGKPSRPSLTAKPTPASVEA